VHSQSTYGMIKISYEGGSNNMDLNDKIEIVAEGGEQEMTISEICNKYKLDATKVLEYVNENDCTWAEAIVAFRPQWYINLLGGIVIPEE